MKKIITSIFVINLVLMNFSNLKADSFNKKYIGIGYGKNAMSSNAEKDSVANRNLRRETILTDSYNGGEDLRFFVGELFSISNKLVHGYEFIYSDINNSNDSDYYSTNGSFNTDFTEARLNNIYDINYRLGKINKSRLDYLLLGLSYADVNYRSSHQNGAVVNDVNISFPGINIGFGTEQKFEKFNIDYRINYILNRQNTYYNLI